MTFWTVVFAVLIAHVVYDLIGLAFSGLIVLWSLARLRLSRGPKKR